MTSPYAHFVRSVTLTLLLLVAACDQSDVTAPVTPPDPSAAIVDGSTTGAFDEFLFLPPLMADPDLTGLEPFPGLDPVVDIDVSHDGVNFTDFREFTSPDIVFDTDRYKVGWDTKESGFEVSPTTASDPITYRVFVRLGALELGYLDIQFGSNGGEAKNLTTGDQVGLNDGRTVPVQFFLGAGLSECVAGLDCWLDVAFHDQDNLFVTRDGDAALFIPAGALPSEPGGYEVTIRELVGEDCDFDFPADLPAGATLPEYNSCYDYSLTPDPIVNQGFTVTFAQCIDEDAVPAGRLGELQLGARHTDVRAQDVPEYELLPNVAAPTTLSCDDYVPGPEPTSSSVAARVQNLGKGLLEFVFGEPLYAGHIGFGGTSRDLSIVKWVDPGLRVAGFTTERGGWSSLNSDQLEPAMDELVKAFDFVWRDTASVLDQGLLSDRDIDVVLLGTVSNGQSAAITPLTQDEQNALFDHVDVGGCAMLMVDNNGFAGAGTDLVNESLIDAFGLDVKGTISPTVDATVTSIGVNHPATQGIQSYLQAYAGWFDGTGSGEILAENPSGPAMVALPGQNNVLGISGKVFAYSDNNQFFEVASPGVGHIDNLDNKILLVQSVNACGTEPAGTVPSTVN